MKINYSRKIKYIMFLVIGFCLININGFSWYNNDFTTYGVNALARIGKFSNYFLADNISKNMAPQIVSDYLIILGLQMGLSYKVVMSILYIITCIILLCGLLYGIKVFSNSECNVLEYGLIFILGIVFLSYSKLGNTISGNLIWGTSFYHQSAAIALTVWAVPLFQKKMWKQSVTVAMVATLFQMHIGTYCFLMCVICMALEAIEARKISVYKHVLWWIVPIVPFVCSVLLENNEKIFSNSEYVELYGRFRHSHHMIPGSWNKVEFIKYAVIVVLFYVLSKYVFELSKDWNRLILIYAFFTAVGLFANWIFTDVNPIPFILKLQPARMITIMNLILMYSSLQFAIKAVYKRDFLLVAYLFFMLVQAGEMNIYFVVSLLLVGIIAIRKKSQIMDLLISVFLILLFGFKIWNGVLGIRFFVILVVSLAGFFVLSGTEIPKWIQNTTMIGIIAITLAVGTKVSNYTENNIDFDLLYLAEWFKENTAEDEQYFADPLDSNLAAFALFSERGTYCFYKNVPIFDEALLEWRNRLEACGIIDEEGERYILKSMELSEFEQIGLCKKYGIKYILTENNTEEYLETGKIKITREKGKYKLLEILS